VVFVLIKDYKFWKGMCAFMGFDGGGGGLVRVGGYDANFIMIKSYPHIQTILFFLLKILNKCPNHL
jgi:hypothetical protein